VGCGYLIYRWTLALYHGYTLYLQLLLVANSLPGRPKIVYLWEYSQSCDSVTMDSKMIFLKTNQVASDAWNSNGDD